MKLAFHTLSPFAAAVAALALTSTAFAQVPAAPAAPGAAPAPTTATPAPAAVRVGDLEKKFIKDFAEQHLVEQDLAQKARSKDTKTPLTGTTSAFYKKLNGDLEKSWTEFATLAQGKKLDIPTAAKASDKKNNAEVAKLEGIKFEKEFVKVMGKEAKRTHALLDTAGKTTRDPEVKAFIEKWGAAFKGHADEAEAAEKALKGAK